MRLTTPISKLPKVGPVYIKRLEKLGIVKIVDLLTHPPRRFLDFRRITEIKHTRIGDIVTVKGVLTFIKNQSSKPDG